MTRIKPRRPVWLCRSVMAAALAGMLLPLASGCTAIRALAAYTAPTTEKIPADFNRLPGKTVAVHVWATPEILWDYPKLRVDVAAYVGAYLSKNVKKVTLIDPLRIESFIEQRSSTELESVEIGRHFVADMVIHLAVYQFSLRDAGMAHFYRGRIASSVTVYDLTTSAEPPDRYPLRDVNVAVPDEKQVGIANVQPDQLRQALYDVFAVEVGKKFHEWEKPLD